VRDLWPHDVCICVLTPPNAGNVGLVGTHGCSSDLLILEPVYRDGVLTLWGMSHGL
jgi:hypothetical protein